MDKKEELEAKVALLKDCFDLAADTGNALFDKEDRADLDGLAGMFVTRASQSLASVAILAQQGYIADAMSCGRTVVEMAIDFPYIAIDPDMRIKKFSDYDYVSSFRLAQAVDRLPGNTTYPQDVLANLRAKHDQARIDNPESKINWAGKSIKDRAIEAGREFLYSVPYADMCNASHSCYGTLKYVLVGDANAPSVRFGPMPPDAHPIGLTATNFLLLLAEVIEHCNLDKALGERATAIIDKFKALADS